MAPKSWGKANTSAKEVIYSLAYKSFPFLQLAESNWKIDLLCSLNYLGWIHNNLDDQGNWLSSHKVKQEEATTVNEIAGGASKKSKIKPLKSKVTEKKFKDDVAEENSLVTPATTQNVSTSKLSVGKSATSAHGFLPITLTFPVQAPTAALPLTSSTVDEGDIPETPDNVSPSTSTSSAPNPPSPPTTSTSDTNIEPPMDHQTLVPLTTVAEEMIFHPNVDLSPSADLPTEVISKPSDNAATASPVIVSPLSTFAKKSMMLKLPSLLPMPEFIAKDTDDSKEGNGKSINENGTCNEFHAYWNNQLSEQQHKEYKTEVKKLVEKEAWDNTILKRKETLY